MGGKGSGGARRGSGRKPKSAVESAVTGDYRGRVLAHPRASVAPIVAEIEEFDAPDTLTLPERHVWMEFAQQAFDKRTLTRSTAGAFVVMCKTILREREFENSRDVGSTNHRGWTAEVRKQMSTFDLWPNGKPIYDAAEAEQKPANPLSRFTTGRRA